MAFTRTGNEAACRSIGAVGSSVHVGEQGRVRALGAPRGDPEGSVPEVGHGEVDAQAVAPVQGRDHRLE
jgi:hypothetical protein